MTKSVTNAQELGPLANALTKDYGALAQECRSAVATSTNNQVGSQWLLSREVEPDNSLNNGLNLSSLN